MKFTLHQTRMFFAGLLSLVFLLWAWADSVWHESGVAWVAAGRPMLVMSRDAALHFSWGDQVTTVGRWRVLDLLRHTWKGETWFPMPSYLVSTGAGQGVAVPYWLILALYLPLWLGLSSRRARRKTQRPFANLPREDS